MQLTQASNPPYKKTSILLNDISPKVPKLDSSSTKKCYIEFYKKHSCSKISPHNAPNNVYSGLPTINTVVSTSNLSTASFSFS